MLTARVNRIHFYFGTDANGRDLMARTLMAGRISLGIGLLAGFVAVTIGVALRRDGRLPRRARSTM